MPGGWSGSWWGVLVNWSAIVEDEVACPRDRARCQRSPICPCCCQLGRKGGEQVPIISVGKKNRRLCLHISDILHKHIAAFKQSYTISGPWPLFVHLSHYCQTLLTISERFKREGNHPWILLMNILAHIGQEQSGCISQILPQSYLWTVYVLLTSLALLASWYEFTNVFPCNLGYSFQQFNCPEFDQ